MTRPSCNWRANDRHLALEAHRRLATPNQLARATPEATGPVKVVKTAIEGLSGVFQHLTHEHGEITALLLRVKTMSDPRARAALFPRIRIALLSHEKGEVAEVYPVFRERTELTLFAEDHDREAGQLEAQVHAVSVLAYDDAKWADRFTDLLDLVSGHTREEEYQYFPAAQRLLGDEAAEQMLVRYEQAKARAAKSEV